VPSAVNRRSPHGTDPGSSACNSASTLRMAWRAVTFLRRFVAGMARRGLMDIAHAETNFAASGRAPAFSPLTSAKHGATGA